MNRSCIQTGCPHPATYRGRCADHARLRNRQINRAGRAIYNTKRWKVLRRRVLFEQPICAEPDCEELAVDVDHIRAIEDGGAVWDRANLQGLCISCHSRKTRREQLTRG